MEIKLLRYIYGDVNYVKANCKNIVFDVLTTKVLSFFCDDNWFSLGDCYN